MAWTGIETAMYNIFILRVTASLVDTVVGQRGNTVQKKYVIMN